MSRVAATDVGDRRALSIDSANNTILLQRGPTS
jgi:hypothetical protein